jgi:hypothetical protein
MCWPQTSHRTTHAPLEPQRACMDISLGLGPVRGRPRETALGVVGIQSKRKGGHRGASATVCLQRQIAGSHHRCTGQARRSAALARAEAHALRRSTPMTPGTSRRWAVWPSRRSTRCDSSTASTPQHQRDHTGGPLFNRRQRGVHFQPAQRGAFPTGLDTERRVAATRRLIGALRYGCCRG